MPGPVTAATVPWRRPELPAGIELGLWANSTSGVRECVKRVYREVADESEVHVLVTALLDMYRLFEAGEVCAPFTAELWRYDPDPVDRIEDRIQPPRST